MSAITPTPQTPSLPPSMEEMSSPLVAQAAKRSIPTQDSCGLTPSLGSLEELSPLSPSEETCYAMTLLELESQIKELRSSLRLPPKPHETDLPHFPSMRGVCTYMGTLGAEVSHLKNMLKAREILCREESCQRAQTECEAVLEMAPLQEQRRERFERLQIDLEEAQQRMELIVHALENKTALLDRIEQTQQRTFAFAHLNLDEAEARLTLGSEENKARLAMKETFDARSLRWQAEHLLTLCQGPLETRSQCLARVRAEAPKNGLSLEQYRCTILASPPPMPCGAFMGPALFLTCLQNHPRIASIIEGQDPIHAFIQRAQACLSEDTTHFPALSHEDLLLFTQLASLHQHDLRTLCEGLQFTKDKLLSMGYKDAPDADPNSRVLIRLEHYLVEMWKIYYTLETLSTALQKKTAPAQGGMLTYLTGGTSPLDAQCQAVMNRQDVGKSFHSHFQAVTGSSSRSLPLPLE